MVLSLKPFGCMPSTQSDGAQAAVVSHYRDMIYLPVETSGEGEINAHSRVQMALGEAKAKAKREFQECLDEDRAHAGAVPRLRGGASRDEAARCTRCRTRKGVVGHGRELRAAHRRQNAARPSISKDQGLTNA